MGADRLMRRNWEGTEKPYPKLLQKPIIMSNHQAKSALGENQGKGASGTIEIERASASGAGGGVKRNRA